MSLCVSLATPRLAYQQHVTSIDRQHCLACRSWLCPAHEDCEMMCWVACG